MEPQSRIWLCKCNLENDYRNSLTFASRTTQQNYFLGLSTLSFNDFTYLRKERFIKVDRFVEDIDTYNYLVLLNKSKYYYYFITSMEYIDDQTTRINIELDVIQTYYFDIEYKTTFVEREHVTDDTVGKHTLPESLETGEYMGSTSFSLDYDATGNIVLQVIYDPDFLPTSLECQYGGVFSGTVFLTADVENAQKIIQIYDKMGQKDYIISIFMYLGNISSGNTYSMGYDNISATFDIVNPSFTEDLTDYVLMESKPTTVGDYTPRNKKLLTYPYTYLLANNMAGGTKAYRFEFFRDSSITFGRFSTVCVGGSVMYVPKGYKPTSDWVSDYNYNESIIGAKYPVCSWISDSYTNWLTQSSVNREYGYKKDIAQTVIGAGITGAGVMTGNLPLTLMGGSMLGGGLANGVGDTFDNMKAKEEHQIAPMELQGLASAGDVVWATNRCNIEFTTMFIREEYAKIIDKYFDMYGYQVNELKTPSIHTRTYWNYLKTQNCNFTGDIPQKDMDKIKAIFNSGITFWHDASKMFDYSQSNTVIS